MTSNLNDLFKPKRRRRSGLSWVRFSGRVKVLSFVAMFTLAGATYLMYTHAATAPAVSTSPSPTPTVSPTP